MRPKISSEIFSLFSYIVVPFMQKISIKHFFLIALIFARSLGTWQMLMNENPCLIPILTS